MKRDNEETKRKSLIGREIDTGMLMSGHIYWASGIEV